jgi:N-carbamoyl-L-amino-acid hydrolase
MIKRNGQFILSFLLFISLFLFFPMPSSSQQAKDKLKELRTNSQRLMQCIELLSNFGKNSQGGIDRVAFSQADIQARDYIKSLMRESGLDVRTDEAGNIIGRKEGSDSSLPPILIGSHIDTVPNGGKYDGALGVLAAIECIQVFGENGVLARHPLEVIVFSDEEGGSVGSRAMIGEFPAEALKTVSQSGKTIHDGILAIGGDPERLSSAARHKSEIAAYLELHIEQGGRLDSKKINIGVVEGIVGINRWDVTIEGFSNHAGTTPMNMRQDALLAASYFIIATNNVVTSIPGSQVGTVGKIKAEPGAPNVIPGLVVLTLELRDLSAAKILSLFEKIRKEAELIEKKTGTRMTFRPIEPEDVPAPTDENLRKCIVDAARELGLSTLFMPSGAGHDGQNIARIAPMGMIFIPSVGGVSHSPKEYSKPEDIAAGANVLLQTILSIDQGCR